MKKVLAFLACFLPAVLLSAQQDTTALDEQKKAGLSSFLEKYCASMVYESIDTQCGETDFIIGSCEDATLRQFVAVWLYDHYITSKVMGHDAVAIYLFDNWFADGRVQFYNDADFLTASVFADLNRNSLIGKKAPVTRLQDEDGNEVTLFEKTVGRPAFLYFYSTDCSKCKLENIMVKNVLENRDAPIDVYLVCTKGGREEWEAVKAGPLKVETLNSGIYHLWDPGTERDWQTDWGVLQTPRAFLIDADGTIIGRGLDSKALEKMLGDMFKTMNYGEPESKEFYDGLFAGGSSPELLEAAAGHIAERCLEEVRDTLLFKQMTGDLLYYLNSSGDGGLRNGMPAFIQEQILSRSDVWNTPDLSRTVGWLAELLHELGGRAAVGEKLPSVKVYGQKVDSKGSSKLRRYKLRSLKNSWLMFYSPGCCDCQKQFDLLEERLQSEEIKVLLVDLDSMSEEYPELFRQLIDSFDLTHVPYITRVDKKGRVTEKYCSF